MAGYRPTPILDPSRNIIEILLSPASRLPQAPQRLRIQYGYLKTLPDDDIGPRHIVTVKQLPPVERGEDWFEWEERPGPEPASAASRPADDLLVRVCYVERTPA